MISIAPLIALLTPAPADFSGVWFRQVGGAAEFARIASVDRVPLPVCYLVRSADAVRPAGERAEDVTLAFDAVIAITNERMARSGETDDALLAYRRAVHALLLGWQYTPAPAVPAAPNAPVIKPVRFDGGKVIEYTDGDLWWADRYVFDAHLTNYLPDPQPFAELRNTNWTTGATL